MTDLATTTCRCGQCRPAEAGEAGLWTREWRWHFTCEAGRPSWRDYRDPVRPGKDGVTRCPNCRDILNDDWTVTAGCERLEAG